MAIYKPSWFDSNRILISTATTCGLTKGGRLLPVIDAATGRRVQISDPETGELVDAINDQLLEDMMALKNGTSTPSLRFISRDVFDPAIAVPVYYDRKYDLQFDEALNEAEFNGFTAASLGSLADQGIIELRSGHGSPSQEQRIGQVPYIKVSDLRAGFVNINPTNRVLRSVAERHWRGKASGLQAFDLLCPERTSKNIGDFCMLMPGQEQVLLTKEIIVLRPGVRATFDSFYLLWAMTLQIVRDQWKRIVFMQTNREDVGKRYLEIRIPIPPTPEKAYEVSDAFRQYYNNISASRVRLGSYLNRSGRHHFFVSGAELEPEVAMDATAQDAAIDGNCE